jgi:hypothetical protein
LLLVAVAGGRPHCGACWRAVMNATRILPRHNTVAFIAERAYWRQVIEKQQ